MSIVEVWQCDSCSRFIGADNPEVARWISVEVFSDVDDTRVGVAQYCTELACRNAILDSYIDRLITMRRLPQVPRKVGKPARAE